MAERALLIASQTAGLRGCEADAELMADALGARGFTCTTIRGAAATRAGILDAYGGLIADTATDDAVVVYYSGHGGRVRNLASINEPASAYWQFVVPTDFERSSPDDFRGVLADELRALQLALTAKTANVTTILDCCHAALMSRDPALVARFLDRPWNELRPGAQARAEAATAQVREVLAAGSDRADAESNQRAVRLVACLPTESAFEMPSADLGGVHGLLTEALAGALALDAGHAAATWDDVARRVRAGVLARAPFQHVVAEGPTRRLLFSVAARDAARGWPVEGSGAVATLPAAALLGIGPGDEVALVADPASSARIAATVARVDGGRAVLQLPDGIGVERVATAVAFPTAVRAARRAVVVEADDDAAATQVATAIAGCERVEVVAKSPAPLARVVIADGAAMLVGTDGMPLYETPRTVDPATLQRLAGDVEQLAKAAVVRELTSGTGEEALDVPVAFTVHPSADGPALHAGVTLPEGPAFFRLHHLGGPNDPPVFANVVDIGQTGELSVLSGASSPTGVQLTPKQSYTLYGDAGGWLSWPGGGLPRDEPRPETLMAVFSDGELDLRPLEASGVAARRGGPPATGTLDGVVALAASGARRSAGPRPSSAATPLRFRVERFDFLLDPGFRLDETGGDAGVRPAATGATATLSIRVESLLVRDRASFATGGRLDLVVVTAGADGVRPACRTTMLEPIDDGDVLAIGDVAWTVEDVPDGAGVALWVSRANQPVPPLAELVADIDEMAAARPGALVELAGRTLRRAVNRSIGLLHAEVALAAGEAGERGTSRRVATGRLDARDVAFRYDITTRDETEGPWQSE